MARRKVITETFMSVKKPAAFGGMQVRKVTSLAKSDRLLKYRGCIASELQGKKFPNYQAVRDAFKTAALKCSKVD